MCRWLVERRIRRARREYAALTVAPVVFASGTLRDARCSFPGCRARWLWRDVAGVDAEIARSFQVHQADHVVEVRKRFRLF